MKISIPSLASSIMLFICLIDGLSYGYFTLLRLIVCGTSIYNSLKIYQKQNTPLFWTFIFIAILFNPLIPVYLDREIWLIIDVICAIIMLIGGYKINNEK